MVRSVSAEELLQSARDATGTRNVREAVRDLTLHALRSRLLTASHIATVARTVGKGIASSDVPPTAPVRDTHRGAWAGLEDAVDQALRAIELAAKEFAEGRARLTPGERERLLAEIALMGRSLGEEWDPPRAVSAALAARIASLTSLLQKAPANGPAMPAEANGQADGSALLSFVASGVLLGMSESPGAHR